MRKFTLSMLLILAMFSLKAQVLFQEDFQAGIPSNFILINNDGLTPASSVSMVNQAWVAYPDFNNATDTAAMSTSWYSPAGTADDWMILPKINLTTGNFLIWRGWAPDQSYADGYQVKISTTDSAMTSFTTDIATIAAEGDPWVYHAVDLSAYNNQSVFIAFRNNSNDKYLLLIDDIVVRNVDSFDVAGIKCNNVTPNGLNNAPFDITGEIANNGSQAITSFDLNYSINGGTTVTSTINSVNIAPFANYTFTHPTQWTPTAAGTYVVKIWASNINGHADMDMTNDTITKSIDIASQSTQRFPLYEEFTSSTCAPCASANAVFTPLLAANPGKFVLIKYQMSWPGSGDPYYTAEGGVRRTYYGVNAVPDLWVDGGSAGNPGSFTANDITTAYAKPAFLSISATMEVKYDHTCDIAVTLDPLTNFPAGTKLFVGIAEKKTVNNVATNGETEFHQVMKKMVPDASGTAITLTNGTQVVKNFSYQFKGNYRLPNNAGDPINHSIENSVEEFEDLTAIVWAQNSSTGEVYQAAEATVTMGMEDANQNTINAIYPNPATNNTNVHFNLENAAKVNYSVVNTLGQTVISKDLGTVAAGQNTETINVSNLASGIYMINMNINGQLVSKKITVK